ncbi:flavin reductase family protein [Acidaminococcus fermentans]|uniref:flavin reductase family protein n=1 Tax=Acidaminococcus fermentans TaxID=905 RepID=UPI002431C551|nr:flavin reductase family protein [Acidaminococcus fermentans]
MQKDIGAVMGLYPTPVTIVGTVAEGRVNWLPVAHVGVVEHTRFLISVDKAHEFSVRGIETNGTVSVSLVNRDILAAADYCGLHKGAQEDKSQVFLHHFDEVEGAPIPDNAPLVMTCRVIRKVEVGQFNNYILEPVHTYVEERYLNERNKPDYAKMRPILFEFRNALYLETGDVAGRCWQIGREFQVRR